MQRSDIGAIGDSIEDRLRRGNCKSVFATHAPCSRLLCSPRNKTLANSLPIEARLYEEQTRRGTSVRHWANFEGVTRPAFRMHIRFREQEEREERRKDEAALLRLRATAPSGGPASLAKVKMLASGPSYST